MADAKILTIDIETSPNLAYVWGLFKQTVSLSQLLETGQVISFAAKWLGDDEIFFYSDFHDGHQDMVLAAWALLNEADIVVTYNGQSFDVKHLNREFWLAGYDPPSPFKQVDLYLVGKKTFLFPSHKLAHITAALGLTGKLEHEGMPLWVKCLEGDADAWATMRAYNIQDVITTEELYLKARPWITNHPNMGLFVDEPRPICDKCGSPKMQKRGVARTGQGIFQRFQCQNCGGWSRSGKRISGVDIRAVAP